jgi:hypothetical protein
MVDRKETSAAASFWYQVKGQPSQGGYQDRSCSEGGGPYWHHEAWEQFKDRAIRQAPRFGVDPTVVTKWLSHIDQQKRASGEII